MPKVSVLMSVFNETKEEIRESVDSILNQSFRDFEFIIINDCPTNEKLKKYLDDIEIMDSRIHIYHNQQNIGLALSMNRAAELSVGQYLARMDADDIAEKERFSEEVKVLESELYDLVFTNYIKINGGGEILTGELVSRFWDDEVIVGRLCIECIIHHPTVMMTRTLFEETGGYRDFPCAQDYDLWLRMAHKGCRFHMINKSLLRYRIRENSVSSKKRLQQKLTHDYTRDLFVERLKKGTDSYSYRNYLNYMNNNIYDIDKQQIKVNSSSRALQKAVEKRNRGEMFGWFTLRLKVFFSDRTYRVGYLKKIRHQYKLNSHFLQPGKRDLIER